MRYCFDTSAFIESWVRHYPPGTFQRLWQQVDELIFQERLFTSEEVLDELSRRDDDVHAWVKARAVAVCLPLDEQVQAAVTDILSRFPGLVGVSATRNRADPWVIATAIVHDLVVVTYEGRGSRRKPKIPDVCDNYGVDCISMVPLIQREGWTY